MALNENAKKWVEALRSGRYEQGDGMLCDSEVRHCCLGVACRVYQEEVGGLDINENSDGCVLFDGEKTELPEKVREWIGLSNCGGVFSQPGRQRPTSLWVANDTFQWTFNQIADLIESEPEGLFDEAT